jgi:NADH-quinone oxidoreductase subunit M
LIMAAFAGCGLPGFANFAGELTVFFGAWSAYRAATILAIWGALVVGAIYLLRAMRAMLQGPELEKWSSVADATHPWRRAPFVVLLSALLLFGFLPRLLTDKIQNSVQTIVSLVGAGKTGQAGSEPPSSFPALARGPLGTSEVLAVREGKLRP